MRIEFADDHLARICTAEAHRLGLPIAIIKAARRRLIQLEAARDERDLRELKSLNYKKRKGDPDGRRSIRINDQYRIFFTLSDDYPPVVTITDIGDPH
jgi:proteic killer suppression protein